MSDEYERAVKSIRLTPIFDTRVETDASGIETRALLSEQPRWFVDICGVRVGEITSNDGQSTTFVQRVPSPDTRVHVHMSASEPKAISDWLREHSRHIADAVHKAVRHKPVAQASVPEPSPEPDYRGLPVHLWTAKEGE